MGLIIISLAIALLARRRRCDVHAPDRHPHVDVHASGSDHAPERPAVERTALQAYGLGLLHGIGGSAGIGLLLLASIHDHTYALLALALFAGFSAISMTAFSGLFGGRSRGRAPAARSIDSRRSPPSPVCRSASGTRSPPYSSSLERSGHGGRASALPRRSTSGRSGSAGARALVRGVGTVGHDRAPEEATSAA